MAQTSLTYPHRRFGSSRLSTASTFVLVGSLVAACGDVDDVPLPPQDAGLLRPDAGHDAGLGSDAGQGGRDTGPTQDAGSGLDAGTAPDGGAADAGMADAGQGVRCERAEALIGPSGGSVELCGARVVVAPGEVEAPVTVSIEAVPTPAPLPAPFTQVGRTWRLSPADFPGRATVYLPHPAGAGDDLDIAYYVGMWRTYGACEQTARELRATVRDLGTLTLVRGPQNLPTAPYELGSGSATLVVQGRTARLATGRLGYAAEHDTLEGFRFYDLVLTDDAARITAFVTLSQVNGIEAATSIFIQDEARQLTLLYDWATGDDRVDVQLEVQGQRLTASLTGALFDDENVEVPFGMTIDATIGRWAPLPERICDE